MKKKILATVLTITMAIGLLTGCGKNSEQSKVAATGENQSAASKSETGKDLTFVIVPKCVHAWFDAVNKGAQQEADVLSKQLGVKVSIDYRAPQNADVAEQNSVLEQANQEAQSVLQ